MTILIGAICFMSGSLVTIIGLDHFFIRPLAKIARGRADMIDRALDGWNESIELLKDVNSRVKVLDVTSDGMVSPIQINKM